MCGRVHLGKGHFDFDWHYLVGKGPFLANPVSAELQGQAALGFNRVWAYCVKTHGKLEKVDFNTPGTCCPPRYLRRIRIQPCWRLNYKKIGWVYLCVCVCVCYEAVPYLLVVISTDRYSTMGILCLGAPINATFFQINFFQTLAAQNMAISQNIILHQLRSYWRWTEHIWVDFVHFSRRNLL